MNLRPYNMNSNTDTFNSVISSGEQFYKLAKDLDIAELEKKIPEYTKSIQQHFVSLYDNELTQDDVENVKKIMSTHEMITSLLNRKKEEISKNIKHLHAGKDMQNTYP